MTRKVLMGLAIGVLASACANPIGRSVPECDAARTSLVLEVQSVPGSAYVSCINGLRTGWDYRHLEARSGRSVFWLDSDRMGDAFVMVESVLSCDVGDATRSDFYDSPIKHFKDVVSKTTVDIVLVPEGANEATEAYALEITAKLNSVEIKGRATAVSVSVSGDSTAARVSRANASGAHVITMSVRDAEEGTLTLILNGQQSELDGDLDQAVDAISDVETQSSYRGKWYFVFEGGCVVYTFDAEGPGVGTIERDIDQALGLYDAEALRQLARDIGYNLP